MGIIAVPVTYTDTAVLNASQLNICNSTIYNEFNGNIDNTNIKVGANIDAAKLLNGSIINAKLSTNCIADANLDYTSVKVLRAGPNLPASGPNGARMACGTKAFTLAAGIVSVTVTYATDCRDGNPQFTAAAILTFGIEHATAGSTHYTVRIITNLASGFTAEINATNVGDATSGTLHWHANGPV